MDPQAIQSISGEEELFLPLSILAIGVDDMILPKNRPSLSVTTNRIRTEFPLWSLIIFSNIPVCFAGKFIVKF